MVHLNRVPEKFKNLCGLLDVFKQKLVSNSDLKNSDYNSGVFSINKFVNNLTFRSMSFLWFLVNKFLLLFYGISKLNLSFICLCYDLYIVFAIIEM